MKNNIIICPECTKKGIYNKINIEKSEITNYYCNKCNNKYLYENNIIHLLEKDKKKQYRIQERIYDDNWENTFSNKLHKNKYDIIINEFKKWKNTSNVVLDIGCGDGILSREIKKNVIGELFGIDISYNQIQKAAKNMDLAIISDLESDIPIESNSVDIAICADIIEHVLNTDKIIKNISRILKNSGILIMSFPNLASLYNRLALLGGYQPFSLDISLLYSHYGIIKRKHTEFKSVGHIKGITIKAIKELMLDYKMNIIGTKSIIATDNNISKVIYKTIKIFTSLSAETLIIAKKY